MKKNILLIIFFTTVFSFGQKKDTLPNFNTEYYLVKTGDTLIIDLEEIAILPKHKFKSKNDVHYYYWFKRKVFKAYPYAVLAAKRIDSLRLRLNKISSKRKQRKYVKQIQNYLEKELTAQLKKLTKTEGRLLIKLIHRQTGKTAFENIREFRSGWKAFWYNTIANLFGLSLKNKYNPLLVNEDYLVEDVLQRAFINEDLENQKPKLKLESFRILQEKKGKINVEKYKQMFAKMRKKKKKKSKK